MNDLRRVRCLVLVLFLPSPSKPLLSEELVLSKMMKKFSLFVASVVAALATTVSVSSSTHVSIQACGFQSDHGGSSSSPKNSASTEKFAPRFDGLKFIETLVTAHR
ncbi:hypothetical protein AHAS_Ahas12G0231300 [Arachis hypogaea]